MELLRLAKESDRFLLSDRVVAAISPAVCTATRYRNDAWQWYLKCNWSSQNPKRVKQTKKEIWKWKTRFCWLTYFSFFWKSRKYSRGNGTVVNTWINSRVIRRLEVSLGRPLHLFVTLQWTFTLTYGPWNWWKDKRSKYFFWSNGQGNRTLRDFTVPVTEFKEIYLPELP